MDSFTGELSNMAGGLDWLRWPVTTDYLEVPATSESSER